ncbi:MAG: polysaccharide biosynthesis/export family protein, partial [Pseudomonadota bacterium]
MRRLTSLLFPLVLLVLLAGGCAAPVAVERAPQAAAQSANLVDEYLIGVDDVVEVTVWRNEDLNASVPVRPDGKISVPLIGDVEAGGKTPEQVAEIIKERLSVYIK